MTKRVWLPIIFIIGLAVIGAFYYQGLIRAIFLPPKPSDTAIQIEQSFGQKQLVALGYINVATIGQFKQVLGFNDSQQTPEFLKILNETGIDPFAELNEVVLAAYSDDKKVIMNAVLLGQFSVNKVINIFKKKYDAVVDPKNPNKLSFSKWNKKDCNVSQTYGVLVTKNKILVTEQHKLKALKEIINNKHVNSASLNDWTQYRKGKIASFSVLNIQGLSDGLSGGMAGMLTNKIQKEHQPMEQLYFGLATNKLSGELDLTLQSHDKEWLNAIHNKLQVGLEEFKNDQKYSQFKHILKRINTHKNAQHTGLTAQVDPKLKKQLSSLFDQFVNQLFSFNPTGNKVAQERIEKNPAVFFNNINVQALKPFNESYNSFFKPDWQSGPFGLQVKSFVLDDKGDVEINIAGIAQNIPNARDEQVKLNVTALITHDGKRHQVANKCLAKRLIEEKPFRFVFANKSAYIKGKKVDYSEATLNKKISLAGMPINQLKEIKGVVTLDLPVRTKTIDINASDKAQLIEVSGTKVLVKTVGDSTVSYQVNGGKSLLAVQAFNRSNQPLSNSGEMSSSNWLGEGKSVSIDYAGTVARIRLVFGEKYEHLQYPFSLAVTSPWENQKGQRSYPATTINLYNSKHWSKASKGNRKDFQVNNWFGKSQAIWRKGVFNLSLHDYKVSRFSGVSGNLVFQSDIVPALIKNLSSLRIDLPQQDKTLKYHYLWLEQDGFTMNGKFVPNKDKPFLQKALQFSLREIKDLPKPLKGVITANLPLTLSTSTHKNIAIGSSWSAQETKVKIVKVERETINFIVTQGRDKLVMLELFDKDNTLISKTSISNTNMSGKEFIQVDYSGTPAYGVMTLSDKVKSFEEDFKLTLVE